MKGENDDDDDDDEDGDDDDVDEDELLWDSEAPAFSTVAKYSSFRCPHNTCIFLPSRKSYNLRVN